MSRKARGASSSLLLKLTGSLVGEVIAETSGCQENILPGSHECLKLHTEVLAYYGFDGSVQVRRIVT